MGGDEGVRVRASALRDQAKRVDGLAENVDVARQAGQSARLGMSSYGVLCTTVPMLVGMLQDQVTGVVRVAADSLLDSGAGLIASARLYEAAEERSMKDLEALEEEVVAALRRGRGGA